MLARVALFIATLTASAVLALGIAMASGSALADPGLQVAGAAATDGPAAPRVQVDTVYLPAPVAPPTITVHRVIRSASAGEDGEGAGEAGDR